eukprot:CAMPEP_0114042654 /NCGR_PEP_ID=MMETSP1339-20121228/5913_1 /TAXON_ID=94617 /ORGANISM="Fibrocapsa japonica" /LENGTH=45 /assembly_acc=CAM_ASM_000762
MFHGALWGLALVWGRWWGLVVAAASPGGAVLDRPLLAPGAGADAS